MLPNPKFRSVPPPWAQHFRTDDLDELRAFAAATAGNHSRVVRGTGRLGFDQSWLTGTTTSMGWVRTELGTLVRGAVREPTLHLDMPAGTSYRIGRRRHEAAARELAFLAPGWQYTLDRPPGPSSGVSVSGEALATEVGRRQPGSRFEQVLRTRLIEPDDAEQAGLAGALDDLALALHPGAERASSAHAEARLVAAVAALLLRRAAVVRGQDVAAARIADLEAWIEANLETPISIGRLCAVAGVGERALQKSFESRRGMSPMRFVTERRLAEARRRLTQADPLDNVTHVALWLGFAKPSRFASLYRETFGESPAETLRRSRR